MTKEKKLSLTYAASNVIIWFAFSIYGAFADLWSELFVLALIVFAVSAIFAPILRSIARGP